MTANGPIALNENTQICSMGFVIDPQLFPIDTPNGHLKFLQVVGLTIDEEDAAKRWSTRKLLDALLPSMPLWITDLHRDSFMIDSAIAAQVAHGLSVDGSSQGYTYTDALQITVQKRLLRKPLIKITLGARQVTQLRGLLPLRLPFARSFTIAGPQFQLVFKPAEQNGALMDGDILTVNLSSIADLLHVLSDKEGRYVVNGLDGVEWNIQKTMITDADGEVVATYG